MLGVFVPVAVHTHYYRKQIFSKEDKNIYWRKDSTFNSWYWAAAYTGAEQ